MRAARIDKHTAHASLHFVRDAQRLAFTYYTYLLHGTACESLWSALRLKAHMFPSWPAGYYYQQQGQQVRMLERNIGIPRRQYCALRFEIRQVLRAVAFSINVLSPMYGRNSYRHLIEGRGADRAGALFHISSCVMDGDCVILCQRTTPRPSRGEVRVLQSDGHLACGVWRDVVSTYLVRVHYAPFVTFGDANCLR